MVATDAAGNSTTQAVSVQVVDRPWVTISSSAGNGRGSEIDDAGDSTVGVKGRFKKGVG